MIPTTLALIEIAAMRLTLFGGALLMADLLVQRVLDRVLHRPLPAGARALAPMEAAWVLTGAALLSAAMLVALTWIVVNGFTAWLGSTATLPSAPSSLALFPLVLLAMLFIWHLAYHPWRVLRWCLGWTVIAHMAVWGQALWTA